MGSFERKLAVSLFVFAMPLIAACNSTSGSSWGSSVTALELPSTVDPYPDNEVFTVAKVQFAEGNFGHAARYYERTVEVDPNNGEAWLGLAASYDRIRRFDLADRAYREAGRLIGDRAEYYNNIGYSYLLRGDAAKARSNFLKAHEIDPTSATINNNLDMLRDNLTRSKPNV
jgi:Flp pilus assembly protein TadD